MCIGPTLIAIITIALANRYYQNSRIRDEIHQSIPKAISNKIYSMKSTISFFNAKALKGI